MPRAKPENFNNTSDIQFLVIDWFECDVKNHDAEKGDDSFLLGDHDKNYVIFAFGVTKEGYSVCLRIEDYHPYFYINIPTSFTEKDIKALEFYFDSDNYDEELDTLEYSMGHDDDKNDIAATSKYYKSAIASKSIEEKFIFWSFMNEQKFKFIKLGLSSKMAHKFWGRYLLKAHNLMLPDSKGTLKLSTYESDLEPLLRFMHDRALKPAGWITIPAGHYNVVAASMQSSCGINITARWDQVSPFECNEIPPLIVASFDIEADSSHGDFPIPDKDAKKLSNQLVIAWLRDMRILATASDKSSRKYQQAEANIASTRHFFMNRIWQALNQNTKFTSGYIPDSDIDRIYLKNPDSAIRCLNDAPTTFNNRCMEIYEICNHPIRKVKTDTAMKKAVKAVEDEEKERREKIAKRNKEMNTLQTFTIKDLKLIIARQSKKTGIPLVELQDKIITKEVMVRYVNQILNEMLGAVIGDPTIQIGTVFWRFGQELPYHNNIITLNTCSPFKVGDKDCEVISCAKEEDVYSHWQSVIKKEDPDIVIGYNIFGFDESFMHDRIQDICTARHMNKLASERDKYVKKEMTKYISYGRLCEALTNDIRDAKPGIINKQLSSSALGDNFLSFFNMPGRLQLDLLKVFQGDVAVRLPSYKLDDVASHFLSGAIKKLIISPDATSSDSSNTILVDNIKEIQDGNFVVVTMSLTGQKLYDGEKIPVLKVDRENNKIVLDRPIPAECLKTLPVWGLAKDDISPMDIFKMQKQGPNERAKIAKYCIQDCALLIRLLKKRDIITNIFGMANVCIVPPCFIALRGQGIKIFSLVVNECAAKNYVLPVLEKVYPEECEFESRPAHFNRGNPDIPEAGNPEDDDASSDDGEAAPSFTLQSNFNVIHMNDDSYEGAIVLNPKPNIYSDPITVMDFGSLYPSEMIASNLSHDCICEDPYWLGDEGAERIRKLGYDFLDRSYDNYTWVDPTNKNKGKKKDGVNTVRYIQYKDEIEVNGKKEKRKGLLPQILQKLLDARKKYKNLMAAEPDKTKAAVLDGLQLAYKITANSLYGQVGAKTSKIYKPAIAASTTAGGRGRIIHARDFVLKRFPGSEVVYGDTDSIFIKFDLKNVDGLRPSGREAIELAIKMGKEAEAQIKKELPPPHKLNYEKVFYPFILITKKRYIGIKYEEDPDKGKNTSMGVVTKRRDNAPILKHTFTGVIDVLMKDRDIQKAIKFVQKTCTDMIDGKFDLNMFVISKTLNAYYKDPESIAHKVLADRMAERDPGNKPATNERIPFIFIKIDEQPGIEYLQGDRIEHVSYVREHKCKVDFEVYITNQIMKPVSQIFELVVDRLPKYPYRPGYFEELEIEYYNKFNGDLVKTAKKVSSEKLKLVKKLVFDPLIQYAIQKVENTATIDKWFVAKSSIDEVEEFTSPASSTVITTTKDSKEPEVPVVITGKKMKQTDLSNWFASK